MAAWIAAWSFASYQSTSNSSSSGAGVHVRTRWRANSRNRSMSSTVAGMQHSSQNSANFTVIVVDPADGLHAEFICSGRTVSDTLELKESTMPTTREELEQFHQFALEQISR